MPPDRPAFFHAENLPVMLGVAALVAFALVVMILGAIVQAVRALLTADNRVSTAVAVAAGITLAVGSRVAALPDVCLGVLIGVGLAWWRWRRVNQPSRPDLRA